MWFWGDNEIRGETGVFFLCVFLELLVVGRYTNGATISRFFVEALVMCICIRIYT